MKELLGFIFSLFLCVFVFAFCHIFSVLFFSSVLFLCQNSFFSFSPLKEDSRTKKTREIIFCDQIGSQHIVCLQCRVRRKRAQLSPPHTGEKTR